MADFNLLLLEAKNSKTDSGRLREIANSDLVALGKDERARIVSALADNPSTDEDTCSQLLRQFPCEALASTRFQLLLLADNQIDWNCVFGEFSDSLPALALLTSIPNSHDTVIRLFETELLSRFDKLSCTFDWKMSCAHEVSIEWIPAQVDEEDANEDECEEVAQNFTVNCTATVDSGNHAILNSPSAVDAKSLFAELDRYKASDRMLDILKSHGWNADIEYTGDGGYFDIEYVEPELDEWSFSASLMGDASGTLFITDPAGVDHEYELPEGDISDSYENHRLDDYVSLTDLFDDNEEALEAFRKIVGRANSGAMKNH